MSLKNLSAKALKYSQLRTGILKALGVLADKVAKLRQPVSLKVGPQIAAADKLRDEILALLPSLEKAHFTEPKSQVLHGVKVGFRKGPDSLDYDEAKSIKLLTDSPFAGTCLTTTTVTTTAINFDALQTLSSTDLARMGFRCVIGKNEPYCTVSDGLDAVAKKLGIGAVVK